MVEGENLSFRKEHPILHLLSSLQIGLHRTKIYGFTLQGLKLPIDNLLLRPCLLCPWCITTTLIVTCFPLSAVAFSKLTNPAGNISMNRSRKETIPLPSRSQLVHIYPTHLFQMETAKAVRDDHLAAKAGIRNFGFHPVGDYLLIDLFLSELCLAESNVGFNIPLIAHLRKKFFIILMLNN